VDLLRFFEEIPEYLLFSTGRHRTEFHDDSMPIFISLRLLSTISFLWALASENGTETTYQLQVLFRVTFAQFIIFIWPP
jgi:hypothetical protein